MECPVCGRHNFSEENSFDICPICGWEDDGVQAGDHCYAGGANHLSVNEARIEFFLLRAAPVREAVLERRRSFERVCREIQGRYAGLNYGKHPERARQREKEFKEAREEYLNALNAILQGIL